MYSRFEVCYNKAMKITFLGTGTMGCSARLNTSFVIDDCILVDIGNGVLNQLRANKLDVKDIKTLIVTHYHADHFGDIVNYLFRKDCLSKDKLTIITPGGGAQKIRALCDVLAEGIGYDVLVANNVEIVELGDGQSYKNKTAEITAFAVNHGIPNCNGYIIKRGGKTIGCGGDTAMCDNLGGKIKSADTWVLESSGLTPKQAESSHTSFGQIEHLAALYPQKTFYVVHRRDYDVKDHAKNIVLPSDNQTVIVSLGIADMTVD